MGHENQNVLRCGTHGPAKGAVVCRHLVSEADRVLGFVENSPDPDDLQAWCGDCEQVFLEEGEMTPRFREFNGMVIVCEFCYAGMKQHHARE